MATSINLTVTGLDVGDRSALADRLIEATENVITCTGGGSGFGEEPCSDIDFQTDVVGPEDVTKIVAFLWQAVGPITGGRVKVLSISIHPDNKE